jgi:hypothetical protein
MNTNMNMQSEIYDARKALGGYLERTDLLLARSGLSRNERDGTIGQIAEQFYDLLGVPIEQADRELTENAIAQLAPERAFELNDAVTTGQILRTTWHRFWIGWGVPIFLNDHGHKRVVWGEMIKMLVWLGLSMTIVFTIITMMMDGPSWKWIMSGILFGFMQIGIWLRFNWLYHHTPVETMPRAEDWSAPRLHKKIRYTWLLIAGGGFLFFIALFPTAYWLVATILNRPAWPIDNGLFVIVSVALGAPLFLLSMWDGWRRRRNTRRFQNWDRWVNR